MVKNLQVENKELKKQVQTQAEQIRLLQLSIEKFGVDTKRGNGLDG